MAQLHTYLVSGKVYIREYGAADAFEFPGLVDTLELSVTEQVISLPDRTQPGGGNYDQVRRIESMTMTINHREFQPKVMARALFGEVASTNSGTVNGEEHTAYKDRFIPLAHPGPYTNVSVTDDATVPQAIDPDNYEVRAAGIYIKEDAPDIVDGDGIKVTYTHPAHTRVQALTQSPPVLEIFFEGLNEANNNNPRTAKFHRVRLGAAATMALLSGDDFGSLQLTGEVLKDTTISGSGVSQYFYGDIVVS